VSGVEGYRYDGNNRRVLAWAPVGGSIVSMYGQNGQLFYQQNDREVQNYEYIYLGDELVATRNFAGSTLKTKYQHTDALGSPVATTNEVGAVVDRTEYAPYGAPFNRPVSGVGYTGHVMDSTTGLVYAQQRYYDPLIGRFMSVDPVTEEDGDMRHFNRYAYAYNNPYKFTDPDGRCPLCLIPFVIGLITYTEEANAPAPGEVPVSRSKMDAVSAVLPPAKLFAPVRMGVSALKQNAASREAKRQAGIPTSQQPTKQTNGQANDGTPVGRQQTYETSKPGGGTETKSVQVSRDIRGEHAGMTQIEAGKVRPGKVDEAGRPRLQNEGKVRVDFDPKK
jgi:RHS repeat-associated protein